MPIKLRPMSERGATPAEALELMARADGAEARAAKTKADFEAAATVYDELSSEYLQRAMTAEAERDELRAALREWAEEGCETPWASEPYECGKRVPFDPCGPCRAESICDCPEDPATPEV